MNPIVLSNSTFYEGDCMDLLRNIPDKSIDFICADLPYGKTENPLDIPIPLNDYVLINRKKLSLDEFKIHCFDKGLSLDYFYNQWNNRIIGLWYHYQRIIKPNGAIALYGQGDFFVDLVNSNRKQFKYDLVWDKVLPTGFLNSKRCPLRTHEQVAIFYKKQPTYNPQFTDGAPLHSKGKNYLNVDHKNQNYGKFNKTDDSRAGSTQKYPTSIQRFAKSHPSVAQHRTEKSVEHLMLLINTYTNKGETVLDNVFGSATTAIAAHKTNRKFIGIEKNENQFLDGIINRIYKLMKIVYIYGKMTKNTI